MVAVALLVLIFVCAIGYFVLFVRRPMYVRARVLCRPRRAQDLLTQHAVHARGSRAPAAAQAALRAHILPRAPGTCSARRARRARPVTRRQLTQMIVANFWRWHAKSNYERCGSRTLVRPPRA